MDVLGSELRSAVRRLLQQPALTAAALLVIALGMGLATAVFSVLNGLVLRPLPYRDPNRLFAVQEIHHTQGYRGSSYGNYLDWSRDVTAFSRTALFGAIGPRLTQVDGRDPPGGAQEVAVGRVTSSLFPLLGVAPALGRWLSLEEERPGRDDTVVLAYGAWQRWFGGAGDVLGRTLALDGRRFTVVGVMPRGFHFNYGCTTAAFVPFTPEATARDARRHATFARLADGASPQQAREQLALVASRLAREYPATNGNWTLTLAPLGHASDLVDPPVVRALHLAFAAALLVLAVCGANVASLLLARAVSRSRELAIRAALGASRADALRLAIGESVGLSLVGTVAGLPLAYAARGAVAGLVPAYLDFKGLLSIDGASLAFAFALALLLGAACGLVPALRTTSVAAAEVLKDEALPAGGRRSRVLGALVAGELAVAVALLVACGLLVRSLDHLRSVPLGYRSSDVVTMAVGLPETRALASVPAVWDQLTSRAERLPGVAGAAVGESPPMSGVYNGVPVLREGRVAPADPHLVRAHGHAVTPGYFRALGIALRRGRLLEPQDAARTEPVAVVGESLARREWGEEDPLGRAVLVAGARRTVVGIVADVRHLGPLDDRLYYDVYVPQAQAPSRWAFFIVQGRGVGRQAPSMLRLVREVDPEAGATQVKTMEAALAEATAEPRSATAWVAASSVLALVLALVGLFGSTAYWVAQRSREVAVRQALGAGRRDVVGLVLGRALRLAAVGTFVGLVAAALLVRTLGALLHGVEPLEPSSYGLAGIVVMAAALLAGVLPALRAARDEPAAVLRRS